MEEVEQTQREGQWIRNEIAWVVGHLNGVLDWGKELFRVKGMAIELESEFRSNEIDVERIKKRLVETLTTLEVIQDKAVAMSKIVLEVLEKLS